MDDNGTIDKKFQKELNGGISALVLLRVLDGAEQPMYGYQIGKIIASEQDEAPGFKQGVLYPVLRSLEETGLLESNVEPSVSGPPRRYYQITSLGHETLRRWIIIWNQSKAFVNTILEGNYHV
ncbi:MAG: PadR family transcriptional regulator [Anaerolineaceae bacterium]|nr:PadR family transcriptional regulator [Anaerolineaceae bacterium]